MKALIGLLLVIVGICGGIYVGVWWAFIGGIVEIIKEIRAPNLEAINIAIGIAKIVFSGAIGWICGIIFVIPGWVMLQE